MNVYKSLIGKPVGKRSLEGHIWGKDFRMNCKYMVWKSVDWVHQVHDEWMLLSFLSKITEFRVTQKGNAWVTEGLFASHWGLPSMEFPDDIKYSISCRRRFLEQWFILALTKSYSAINDSVYRTKRWIKRDQLDVTCFIFSLFNAQHVSSGACDLFV